MFNRADYANNCVIPRLTSFPDDNTNTFSNSSELQPLSHLLEIRILHLKTTTACSSTDPALLLQAKHPLSRIGEAFFKFRRLCESENVMVFSYYCTNTVRDLVSGSSLAAPPFLP
jgi:hypothetical protein